MSDFNMTGFFVGAMKGAGDIAKGWIDVEQQADLRQQYAQIEAAKEEEIMRFKKGMIDQDRQQVGDIISQGMAQQTPFQGEATGAQYSRDPTQEEQTQNVVSGLLKAGRIDEAQSVAKQAQSQQQLEMQDSRYNDLYDLQNRQLGLQENAQKITQQHYQDDADIKRKALNQKGAGGAGGGKPGDVLNAMKFSAKEWSSQTKDLDKYFVVQDPLNPNDKGRTNLTLMGFGQGEMNRLRNAGDNPYDASTKVGANLQWIRSTAETMVQNKQAASLDDGINKAAKYLLDKRLAALQQGQQNQTPQAAPIPQSSPTPMPAPSPYSHAVSPQEQVGRIH